MTGPPPRFIPRVLSAPAGDVVFFLKNASPARDEHASHSLAIGTDRDHLLAVSDLVFLDPVSTGYSRAIKGTKPGPFHGYQGDVESVAELIRLWTSRHGRWMSPKLLAGENRGKRMVKV